MVSLPKAREGATYADYEALPEGTRAELLGGEILMSPQPKGRHIAVATALVADLSIAFGRSSGPTARGPGGWWILYEPECHLDRDKTVFVPDLAGWRRERMPVRPMDTHKHLVVPDWICEVLSPSTAGRDNVLKMPRYLAAGVRWAWIVDPAARHLDVFRAAGAEWELVVGVDEDATAALPPFDAVELDLAPWWADR